MAQHSIQKLRTLRHPNILTYVDSADLEDAVVLVTERVLPLRSWLQSLPPMHALDQLTWGLKNIGNAVSFLQSKCNMLHGALSLDAIFVTP
jgi:SCY1-like protein 1